MDKKLLFLLLGFFIITQCIGLFVADRLIAENITTTIITDNPNDVENSIGLILYILFFTAMLLIIIKFFAKFSGSLFKVLELLAVFSTSTLVFYMATNSDISIIFALILVAARIIFSQNIWLRNFTSIIATAGAGSLVGVSLGILPVIVFMVLLGIYDFIAVFKTKHMVTIAKAITKKNLSFTYALPTKEHQFELGTGDLVVPLIFSASILSEFKPKLAFPLMFAPSAIVLIASFIGLVITMEYASRNPGKALPALPLQTILMALSYAAILLLF